MIGTSELETEVIAIGRAHAAATIYEAIGKRGEVGPSIQPVAPGMKLSGLAVTVRCLIGDTRAIWAVLDQAPPGAVIVVDNGGTAAATAIGGTSVRTALKRGLAGFVVNGAVRDLAEIRALGLPVFAAGIGLRGTQKIHPGWHGVPLAIGHASVMAGDLVVGDDDGVVIVPRAEFPALRERVERQAAKEASIDARIEAGESVLDVQGLR